MWTAKLREARRENGRWNVAIIYSDGSQEFVKGYTFDRITDSRIKAIVRAEVADMNAAETETVTLTGGGDIDLTPPVTPPAPPPDPAREEFFTKWYLLNRLMRLANHGLILPDDSRIVATQTWLKANWLNDYLDGI